MAPSPLKKAVVIANILLFAAGAVITALCGWILLDKNTVLDLMEINSDGVYGDFSEPGLLESALVIAMACGCIMVLLSVVACCGASRESKVALALYSGILLLVLLCQGGILALTVLQYQRIEDDLRPALKEGIRTQYEGYITSTSTFSDAMDNAQVKFECCGVDSWEEYPNTSLVWADRTTLVTPKSCCKVDKSLYLGNRQYEFLNGVDCARNPYSNNSNFETPCYDGIRDWMDEKIYLVLGGTVVVAVVQIVAMVIVCCFLRNMPHKDIRR